LFGLGIRIDILQALETPNLLPGDCSTFMAVVLTRAIGGSVGCLLDLDAAKLNLHIACAISLICFATPAVALITTRTPHRAGILLVVLGVL